MRIKQLLVLVVLFVGIGCAGVHPSRNQFPITNRHSNVSFRLINPAMANSSDGAIIWENGAYRPAVIGPTETKQVDFGHWGYDRKINPIIEVLDLNGRMIGMTTLAWDQGYELRVGEPGHSSYYGYGYSDRGEYPSGAFPSSGGRGRSGSTYSARYANQIHWIVNGWQPLSDSHQPTSIDVRPAGPNRGEYPSRAFPSSGKQPLSSGSRRVSSNTLNIKDMPQFEVPSATTSSSQPQTFEDLVKGLTEINPHAKAEVLDETVPTLQFTNTFPDKVTLVMENDGKQELQSGGVLQFPAMHNNSKTKAVYGIIRQETPSRRILELHIIDLKSGKLKAYQKELKNLGERLNTFFSSLHL